MNLPRKGWRQKALKTMPVALLEYPYECFIVGLGGLFGVGLLLGTFTPGSLFALLNHGIILAYSVALFVGSCTVLTGLLVRPRNPIIMALGLRLTGGLFGIYGLAVFWHNGLEVGGVTGFAFLLIGALALLRAWHHRASSEVAMQIHRGG